MPSDIDFAAYWITVSVRCGSSPATAMEQTRDYLRGIGWNDERVSSSLNALAPKT